MSKENRLRLSITFITLLLVICGIYMVFSASNVWAEAKFNDKFYYFKRQSLFAGLGILGFIIASQIKTSFLKKHAFSIVLVTLVLLGLVLIPGLGIIRNGSRSWFGIGSFAFQPSELFKIALVIYVSKILDEKYDQTKKIKGFLSIIFITLLGFLLIMLQPDFGTAIVMLASIVVLMFTSRLPIKYYLIIGGLGVTMMVLLILIAPYRFDRITSFIDPWSDPLGTGFQIIQSLYALGPGALLGNGLLNSYQKRFYLPEPQTDFIYAIVVEEFGLLGGILLLFAFGYLFYKGFKFASSRDDQFSSFLITGLLGLIFIQVIINLGVVVSLLPVTGITLPLISYGGSSLSVTLVSLGLVVGRKNKEKSEI